MVRTRIKRGHLDCWYSKNASKPIFEIVCVHWDSPLVSIVRWAVSVWHALSNNKSQMYSLLNMKRTWREPVCSRTVFNNTLIIESVSYNSSGCSSSFLTPFDTYCVINYEFGAELINLSDTDLCYWQVQINLEWWMTWYV